MKIVIDTGQDGTIINARVRQKAATEAEWLSKDPEILDGEAAFVRRADGAPVNFKLGDGNKKFSELPYFVTGDAGEFINVMGTELPVSGPNFPDKGYAVVGPGTYTQPGGPDVVVPSGHMGILNWDGSVWYLGSSVEMPDNSAKIAEWEAGTYEQDEVVTVDGIIYRATEQTNEEPPSDQWEAIGGGGNGIKFDVEGGALSYDKFIRNKSVKYNPTELKLDGNNWLEGKVPNTNGSISNSANRMSTGFVYLEEGMTARFKVGVEENDVRSDVFVYDLDFNLLGIGWYASFERTEGSYQAVKDCYINISSRINNEAFLRIEAKTDLDKRGLFYTVNPDTLYFSNNRTFNSNGESVARGGWRISEFNFVPKNSRVKGRLFNNSTDSFNLVKKPTSRGSFEVIELDAVGGVVEFDFEVVEDTILGVSTLTASASDSFVEIHSEGEILVKETVFEDSSAFVHKRRQFTDTAGYTESSMTDATELIFLQKGNKITANLYQNQSTSNRLFVFNEDKSRVLVPPQATRPVGELATHEYTALTDCYIGLSTSTQYGDDYGYKIEYASEYENVDYLFRDDVYQKYRDGKPYLANELVHHEGGIFRAKRLTFDDPLLSKDYEEISKCPMVTDKELIVDIPYSYATVELSGYLPTDSGPNRTPSFMKLDFSIDGKSIFKSYALVNIQGQSSANHPKKGYKIGILNYKRKKLNLKFFGGEENGDGVVWPADDEFHLKGFWEDEIMTRDVSANRLWRQFLHHKHYEWVEPLTIPEDGDSKKEFYKEDARFITDGFPIVITNNGEFLGAYIWRQKKTRESWGIVKDNFNHTWLQADSNGRIGMPFQPEYWDVRNPKMEGYDSLGPIPDPEVQTRIERVFTWVDDVQDDEAKFNAEHAEYIDLEQAILYIIFSELIYNIDGMYNNFFFTEYGNGVWIISPYDLDSICGYTSFSGIDFKPDNRVLSRRANRMLNAVYKHRLDDVKSKYIELKKADVITVNNLYRVFKKIPAQFGPDILKDNFDKWESRPYIDFGDRSSTQRLMQFFIDRINYLDSIWDD